MKISSISSFSRRLQPSLTLGAIALGTQFSDASVVYNDFTNLVLGPEQNFFVIEDIDGFVLFNLGTQTISTQTATPTGSGYFVRFNPTDLYNGKQLIGGGYSTSGSAGASFYTATSGIVIDASSTFFNTVDLNPNLSNQFAGVKIDAGGGNFNYGWIRFSSGPGIFNSKPNTITLLDAAYENTPNQSITTGAIPEPSVVALLGLAGGAVALRRRYQKRKS
jgi:hypothetical protein